MEIELKKNRDTLFHHLTEWNQIEKLCRSLLPKDALGEKKFLKLRLAEYDRLHERHGGSSTLTRDERVMATMMRIERSELEKHLYPSLLSRMLRRAFLYLRSPINTAQELKMVREAGMQSYLSNWMDSIPARAEQRQSPIQQEQTVKAATPEYGPSEKMVQKESYSEAKIAPGAPSVKEQEEVPQQKQPIPNIQGQSQKKHQWKPKPPRNRDTRPSW